MTISGMHFGSLQKDDDHFVVVVVVSVADVAACHAVSRKKNDFFCLALDIFQRQIKNNSLIINSYENYSISLSNKMFSTYS